MSDGAAPLGVTLIIAALNEAARLPGCLEAVRAQRFPAERLEVLVVDGGSTDGTQEIAREFGARVIHNPLKRAEPGYHLGIREARHPVTIAFAADNGFTSPDWLATVMGTFERADVRGVYTHVEPAPQDSPFCRYFNLLHADPFNWFVYGPPSPRLFERTYPVLERGDGYTVYDLGEGEPPLLALVQGFALKGGLPDPENLDRVVYEEDDILAVWDMIERGERFAYIGVGLHHHTVEGFRDFLRKYLRRATTALQFEDSPYRARQALLSRRRRARRWLWIPYSLTLVGPAIDAVRGLARDRDPVWLYHPVTCVALSGAMVTAVVRARAGR